MPACCEFSSANVSECDSPADGASIECLARPKREARPWVGHAHVRAPSERLGQRSMLARRDSVARQDVDTPGDGPSPRAERSRTQRFNGAAAGNRLDKLVSLPTKSLGSRPPATTVQRHKRRVDMQANRIVASPPCANRISNLPTLFASASLHSTSKCCCAAMPRP